MVEYLKGTPDLHLVLSMNSGIPVAKWFVDAGFVVHGDFKSHTGSCLMLGDDAVISSSSKQKLNTRSSTEAELVGCDDAIGKILWTLRLQGFAPQQNIIYQDNQSAILLEKKGFSSAGKWMRHINVRCFFIKDCVDRGEVIVEYCNTKNVIADFLTKPLQGKAFLISRIPFWEKFRRSVVAE